MFNGSAQAGNIECVAWVSANEWVTGAQDGSLARWSALKKKPAGAWQAAHGARSPACFLAQTAPPRPERLLCPFVRLHDTGGKEVAAEALLSILSPCQAGPVPDAAPEGAAGKKGSWGLGKGPAAAACRTAREAAGSAGTGACESWVSALATAPGSDLLGARAALVFSPLPARPCRSALNRPYCRSLTSRRFHATPPLSPQRAALATAPSGYGACLPGSLP